MKTELIMVALAFCAANNDIESESTELEKAYEQAVADMQNEWEEIL